MSNEGEQVYADFNLQRLALPAAAAALVLALAGLVAVRASGSSEESEESAESAEDVALTAESPQDESLRALERFVAALHRQDLTSLNFAFDDGPVADAELASLVSELGPVTLDPIAGTIAMVDASTASAPFSVRWTLEDGTVFATDGSVDLRLVGTDWLVDWEPAILESSLDPGDVLVKERAVAPRAPILGAGDVPLVDNRPVVNIGVTPRMADDVGALSEALGRILGIDPAEIQAAVAPAPSDSIVPIATWRPEDLEPLRAELSAYPAVVLEDATYPLAIDERFARALLGRASEVTAEILEENPEIFIVGDVVGRSGLQRSYNARLAGVPGFQIRVKRRFPTSSSGGTSTSQGTSTSEGAAVGSAADPDVIFLDVPVEGQPLRLTLDPRIQQAAEEALTRTELPSSLVAIQPSTGNVLAVANGPGIAFTNNALTGQYPPGSVFKTITAYAALAKGATPEEVVDCPFDLEVNGRRFTNAEGEKLGPVSLWQAYVQSCNTAFINLANRFLSPSDLPAFAASFGVGAPYSLGTAAFSGNVPVPGGSVDFAAASFGQAETLISPLAGAVMAATAASGTYRPPVLVVPDGPEYEQEYQEPVELPPALDPIAVANLQSMMRGVVTNGTGGAVANVAGGPVSGKTGTAEFGAGDPPPAHAWFIGFQGDVAFAVFVEGGEFGGSTAAPIAGDFLNRIAG